MRVGRGGGRTRQFNNLLRCARHSPGLCRDQATRVSDDLLQAGSHGSWGSCRRKPKLRPLLRETLPCQLRIAVEPNRSHVACTARACGEPVAVCRAEALNRLIRRDEEAFDRPVQPRDRNANKGLLACCPSKFMASSAAKPSATVVSASGGLSSGVSSGYCVSGRSASSARGYQQRLAVFHRLPGAGHRLPESLP